MARKKKDPTQEEILGNQLERLILASEREFSGEIGRMALKDITDESRRVLYGEEEPEDE